ncbi:MAG: hypothetical protein MR343_01110 [Clostridia bacterium]|nr:hypothetical protein [Clostridia bacterium]MDD7700101.1 hypothetical protein [Eubacteriales bacterium]MDY2826463.1 hypothetical protein [Eubacteriales bacterium]
MEKREPEKKKSAIRRLFLLNLLAFGTFLILTVVMLWALGLLPSIFKFIF